MDSLLPQLETISATMNRMTLRHDAVIFYDLLADALYWTDEIPPLGNHRPRDFWCLRFVLRYRTSLILNDVENEYEDYWTQARIHFPNWAGFHPSRCNPDEKHAEIYRKLKAKGMQSVNGADVEGDGPNN